MDDAAPTGLARLWQTAGGERQARLGLSLDRVVDAAIALADEGGLEAVSMARVAERLGFTTMSLYRHVANKDELLLFMHDRAWTPADYTDDPDRPWRVRVTDWCQQMRAYLLRHLWLERISIADRMGTPSQLTWQDHGLATLEHTPLPEDEKNQVLLLLNAHVFYDARVLADMRGIELGGRTFEEAAGQYFEAIRAAADADRFPALHRAVNAGTFTSTRPADSTLNDADAIFAFGLDTILDGVELRVARAASAGTER